jgi:hypothetical protein
MKHVEDQAAAFPWLFKDTADTSTVSTGAGAGAGADAGAGAGAGAGANDRRGGRGAKPSPEEAAIAAENRRLLEEQKRRFKKPAFIDMQVLYLLVHVFVFVQLPPPVHGPSEKMHAFSRRRLPENGCPLSSCGKRFYGWCGTTNV